MHDVWKFIGEYWWLLIWPAAGAAEWSADQFDAGIGAIAKRRARKIAHKQKVREIELEAKRRQLDRDHPQPVKPECGCTHHLSFHAGRGPCNATVGTGKNRAPCGCQQYIGPEPLSTLYAPEIAELET